MNLILPVAGKSSRFPNLRPKFLLTHPYGCLMLTESIKGLNLNKIKQIIIVALKEHEEKYNFSKELLGELKKVSELSQIKLLLLDKPTNSQPETVSKAIEKYNLKGGILIKDSDNYFKFDSEYHNNTVIVADLQKCNKINAGNKSYVNIGVKNTVTNIAEKKVISNLFCCGGYYFAGAQEFLKHFKEIKDNVSNIYISHIIYKMILDKQIFFAEEASDYIDWGTLEDWMEYKKHFSTIFVDIDGVLLVNGGKHCTPKWGEGGGIQKNIDILNKLYDSKKTYIVITTSRPEEYKKLTKEQLSKSGLKYHRIIMSLPHSQRILINDHAKSNPYPSAIAINLERNSDKLEDILKCYE